MQIKEYITENKHVASIPTWPHQWRKGSILMHEFMIGDDEDGYCYAQAYMAQSKRKTGKWVVIARSGDMGMEDRSSTFNSEEDAFDVFNQLSGKVSWGDLCRLVTWP